MELETQGNYKGGRAKLAPDIVTRFVISVVVVGALAALYTGRLSLLPDLFSADHERGVDELALCHRELSSLINSLRKRDRKLLVVTGENATAGSPVIPGITRVPQGPVEEDPRTMDSSSKDKELQRLQDLVRTLEEQKRKLEARVVREPRVPPTGAAAQQIVEEAVARAEKILQHCDDAKPPTPGPEADSVTSWRGYECSATKEDMARYLNYMPGGLCPNDWYFVQKLIFQKNCFALPRRRCFAITPAHPSEPFPLPDSLFNQRALMDENVRWDLMECKSYECLNTRTLGDCIHCFNMSIDKLRWQATYNGGLPMKDVLAMKPGSIRIGLDVGGGTGSFAAHMAMHDVTVLTTAFNVETVPGHRAGLPYMETMAQRGVFPLHWPHKARLPLYDGVLDIIHSANTIKYISQAEFQELACEWDRVLRPGGLLWFEMFYAAVPQMAAYVAIIDSLGYKRLYWNFTPKSDKAEQEGEHFYLNCVLEKPARPGEDVLSGPSEEDMESIV